MPLEDYDSTVSGFLVEIGDICRFSSPKELPKFAEFALVENRSRKHRGQTTISRRGRKRRMSRKISGYCTPFFTISNASLITCFLSFSPNPAPCSFSEKPRCIPLTSENLNNLIADLYILSPFESDALRSVAILLK